MVSCEDVCDCEISLREILAFFFFFVVVWLCMKVYLLRKVFVLFF